MKIKVSLDTGLRPDQYTRGVKNFDELTNGVKYIDISYKKDLLKRRLCNSKIYFAQFSQK